MTATQRAGRVARALGWLLPAVTVAVVLSGARLWAAGWRLWDMVTPSMGTVATVGSLVVTRPVRWSSLRTGELITFHQPGTGTVFTHRVVALLGSAVRTRGALNGASDPWVVRPVDLVGHPVAVLPDAGFALHALPWLLLGAAGVSVATRVVRAEHRRAVRIVAWSAVGAVVLAVQRPLTRMELMAAQVVGGQGRAAVVDTGVLPMQVRARGGSGAAIDPGQVATVVVRHLSGGGLLRLVATLQLHGWWWAVLAGLAVPVLAALPAPAPQARDLRGRARYRPRPAPTPPRGCHARAKSGSPRPAPRPRSGPRG